MCAETFIQDKSPELQVLIHNCTRVFIHTDFSSIKAVWRSCVAPIRDAVGLDIISMYVAMIFLHPWSSWGLHWQTNYSRLISADQNPSSCLPLSSNTMPPGLTPCRNRAAATACSRLNPRHLTQPEGRADRPATLSEPRRWSQPRPPPVMQPYCPPTISTKPPSSFFHFTDLSVIPLHETQTYAFLLPHAKSTSSKDIKQ